MNYRVQLPRGIAQCCLRIGLYTTLLVTLWGCGGNGGSESADTAPEERSQVQAAQELVYNNSPYQFANACYEMYIGGSTLAVNSQHGGYELAASDTLMDDSVAKLFLKPSGLGTYLLYDQHTHLLGAHDLPVRTRVLDHRLEWRFESAGQGKFFLRSTESGQWLAGNGAALALVDNFDQADAVGFKETNGCTPYPEASTNAQGKPTTTTFADGSVWGVADVHAHLFGTLAFGGNVMVGDVFHPLGITKALEDCSNQHGVGGKTDITGFVTETGSGDVGQRAVKLPFLLLFNQPLHNTDGYPDFTEWPNNRTTTHQIAYYKWLERAYLGGLRLMVNLLVESGPLCKVGRELSKNYAPIDDHYEYDEDVVCNGEATSERQLQETYALMDYIDAQHGGPGKGWLRIVKTPKQARQVIKDGKLAMIIGSETPDLFRCIDGIEGGREECSYDYIEQRLDEYDARGIKGIFPVHHYDNDFGGALVFNPIIEIAGVVQDGSLFHYEVCEGGYDPILALKLPSIYYMLFPNFMRDLPLFPFVPEGDGYCNRRGLTDLGAHLIREMMKRGMIIETAHMSPPMKEAVIEMAEYYDYPLVDSHKGKAFADAAKPEEARYLSLGGIRAPLFNRSVPGDYQGVMKTCRHHTSQDMAIQLMAFSDTRRELGLDPGVAFGTDMHGMVQQAFPRFGEYADCDVPQSDPVTYPFTSFDGAVTFNEQVTGNRVFNYNTDGLAHVGLLPDVIQDMRNQGMNDHYIEMFFRGAESYLQMWEKAQARSRALTDH